MKKTLLTLWVLALCTIIVAQNNADKAIKDKTIESGTVFYEETVKLEIKLEGEAANFAHALPKERKSNKVLYFNKQSALYQNNKEDDVDETIGDQQEGVVVKIMEPDNKMFTDLENKKQIEQREFMTRVFLIEHGIASKKWKLSGNHKTILNYHCQEAEMEIDGKKIKAWFCPSIPISIGPGKYGDLPGLILAVNIDDGQNVITAKSIDLKPIDKKLLKKPKKGKKVTDEEFKKIVEEKMKEMGNEGGQGGGRTIMIKIKN